MSTQGLTKGLRNNNPGNIRFFSAIKWVGQLGEDKDGFIIFNNPANGIRAISKNLNSYFFKRRLTTIRSIINRWAPSNENDTSAYVESVSVQTGIDPDKLMSAEFFDTSKPVIIAAIIRHENGTQPFKIDSIAEWAKLP